MTVHFAYGSNMSRALMQARCPTARALGTARLDGWRFIVTQDGYASIVPSPGSAVHGVLWQLAPRDLAALNTYESLHTGLYRPRILPVRFHGRILRALTYIGRSRQEGRPRSGYQNGIVVPAARGWELPERYVAELSRWSPTAWCGARPAEPGDLR